MYLINNLLDWDGSFLGHFPPENLLNEWQCYGIKYQLLAFDKLRGIFCTLLQINNSFPCIIEDIKELFGILHRKYHRATIGGKNYLLFFVATDDKGRIFPDLPLNKTNDRSLIRLGEDTKLRLEVQTLIVLNDILSLTSSNDENKIVLRQTSDGCHLMSINERATTLTRQGAHDFSILNKNIINLWFPENISIAEITKGLISNFANLKFSDDEVTAYNNIKEQESKINFIIMILGNKLEEIIYRHDKSYIWYRSVIIDRLLQRADF